MRSRFRALYPAHSARVASARRTIASSRRESSAERSSRRLPSWLSTRPELVPATHSCVTEALARAWAATRWKRSSATCAKGAASRRTRASQDQPRRRASASTSPGVPVPNPPDPDSHSQRPAWSTRGLRRLQRAAGRSSAARPSPCLRAPDYRPLLRTAVGCRRAPPLPACCSPRPGTCSPIQGYARRRCRQMGPSFAIAASPRRSPAAHPTAT